MKLVLVGVPGSGKSTIISEVQRYVDVKVVVFGDYVLEACKKYGVKTRDDIRKKTTPVQFRKAQEEAAVKISKIKGDIIIDTHASIKTPLGYFPGMPENVVGKLKPDVFVILEFIPLDIYERRKSDASRARDEENAEAIELQQQINRAFIASAASTCNAYVKVISLREKQRKPFEHTKLAADEVIKALRYNK